MARGPVIFASDDSPEALADAKAYILRFNLTQDDVSLLRKDGQTLVVAKRNVAAKIKAPANEREGQLTRGVKK
jgi:hypothetical protein